MEVLHVICQLIIGLGILNVWLLRSKRKTPYRGGGATSLKEEFAAYGLPAAMMWVVGILKVGAALALLVGLFVPATVKPAALVVAVLMMGALIMHAKVKDPPTRSLPAVIMLALALVLIFTNSK